MAGVRITTRNRAETHALGEALGQELRAGDLVGLSGELGAGKTVLAQGLACGLGVTEPVSSPTFSLVHEYRGRLPVWHLDTYRVASLDELIDLSWNDLLAGSSVILIEWPERIRAALPADRLDVALRYGPGDPGGPDAPDGIDDEREIELRPHGERMQHLLVSLTAGPALAHLRVRARE